MTDIRLSIAVTNVDVPQRRAWLNQMIRKLGGLSEINKRTVHWSVVKDYNHAGIWITTKRCLAEYAHNHPTHHVVLQDDMMPCYGYFDLLYGAIQEKPDSIISTFSMRRIALQVVENGGHWFISDGGTIWGGTYVLPVVMIPDFLSWEAAYIDQVIMKHHDDSRLALWANYRGHTVWNVTPSLVEHVGAAHSLVGQSNPRRVAAIYWDNWPGRNQPVDWKAGINKPPRSPSSYIKSSREMWRIIKERDHVLQAGD
jgi:hypothetical protein